MARNDIWDVFRSRLFFLPLTGHTEKGFAQDIVGNQISCQLFAEYFVFHEQTRECWFVCLSCISVYRCQWKGFSFLETIYCYIGIVVLSCYWGVNSWVHLETWQNCVFYVELCWFGWKVGLMIIAMKLLYALLSSAMLPSAMLPSAMLSSAASFCMNLDLGHYFNIDRQIWLIFIHSILLDNNFQITLPSTY